MEISRNRYLDRLIAHKGNQRVKIVTRDNVMRHHDENGVLIMGLQDFMMDERSVEKE